MANSLASVVDKFTTKLDETVEKGTLTADLNMNGDLVGEMTNTGKIEIATIALSGLADHTRGGGFVRGGITTGWETVQLAYDRDREFSIDAMDDEERAAIVSGNAMNQFARTKVVPEVDAIRFAKLAASAGNSAAATFSEAAAARAAVLTAEEALEDYGASLSDCLFWCTSAFKTLLRLSTNYQSSFGENPNTNFKTYDEMKMIPVPSDRFYTAIDLLDGTTTGETDGGYAAASTGKGINFMIVEPRAAAAISKHVKLRYFSPDVNQEDDAHLWQYRIFHDLFVYANKKNFIYMHRKA